jgi:hypothetical protein
MDDMGDDARTDYGSEPPLAELLGDPLVRLLMERDGVEPGSLAALLDRQGRALRARTTSEAA